MKTIINEELLAAFLEGNTTMEESATILREAEKNEGLRQLLTLAVSMEEVDGETATTPEAIKMKLK